MKSAHILVLLGIICFTCFYFATVALLISTPQTTYQEELKSIIQAEIDFFNYQVGTIEEVLARNNREEIMSMGQQLGNLQMDLIETCVKATDVVRAISGQESSTKFQQEITDMIATQIKKPDSVDRLQARISEIIIELTDERLDRMDPSGVEIIDGN